MSKLRVLVTGASGFVGRNLSQYLAHSGFKVHAFAHSALDLLDADAVASKLSSIAPGIVMHCAAFGGNRKAEYYGAKNGVVSSNLRMFFNLARSLKPGTRMIVIGSGAEYDKRRDLVKVREDNFDEHVPADDYGYAKYVISKYIEKADNIFCLRIFGLYGQYEDYTYKFISNAIVKNLLGLPIVINQNVKFDYLWIGDFCRLVEKFIGIKPKYRHYNVTPDKSIDLLDLARIVNVGGSSKIKVLKTGLNSEYTGDNTRLLKEIGVGGFASYEEGVRQLRRFYSARLKRLDLSTVKKDPYLKLCK